jgi:hypothetical protein
MLVFAADVADSQKGPKVMEVPDNVKLPQGRPSEVEMAILMAAKDIESNADASARAVHEILLPVTPTWDPDQRWAYAQLMADAARKTEQPFPEPPEHSERVRVLIWVCVNCNVGRVRVFADFPSGLTTLLWQGQPRDHDDPALDSDLQAARMFYSV